MKSIRLIFAIIFTALFFCSSAQIIIDDANKDQPSPPIASFEYLNQVVLKPGFSVNAATYPGGVWYAKPYQTVNSPRDVKNYVRKETVLIEGVTTEAAVAGLPVESKTTEYGYVDSYGRPTQTVTVRNTPLKADLISFNKYDGFGRREYNYLPFAANNAYYSGTSRPDPVADVLAFYNANSGTHPQNVPADNEPFSFTVFDNSPANQARSSYGPGFEWHSTAANKPANTLIKVNSTNEVRLISFVDGSVPSIIADSYHPANTLVIEQVTNEENQIHRTYKNFKGEVILERKGDGTTWFDTYKVYDVLGRLVYAIPPEATNRIFQSSSDYIGKNSSEKQTFLDTWAFQYKYDEFSRNTDIKVPDSGWKYLIYDAWDRLVLTQDAKQALSSQWTFTKYDVHNRPIMTGLTTGSRSTLVTAAASPVSRYEIPNNNSIGYSNAAFPIHSDANLQTITYYDNYDFIGYSNWEMDGQSFSYVPELGLPSGNFATVKGYTTGSKVKNLQSSSWLNSVTYYDSRYRVIQTTTENHLGGKDRTSSFYDDLTGLAKKKMTTHATSLDNVAVLEEYVYDHGQRLKTITHKINSATPIVMVSNQYNELGQLVEKNVHSTNSGASFLQSVDMRYNIRGWLKSINNSDLSNDGVLNNDANDLFGMEIQYNQSPLTIADGDGGTYSTPQLYNGNISSIKWKSNTLTSTPAKRVYGFQYDQLNRFKKSYYAEEASGNWNSNPGFFNEAVARYDANGNIGGEAAGTNAPALNRYGLINGAKTSFDNLTYRYNGNRLMNVTDGTASSAGFSDKPGVPITADEFVYYENGNLKEDPNKSITLITYNHLNLPEVIEFTRLPSGSIDRLELTYDAVGNKLSRVVKKAGTQVWRTDYVGGIQYDNNVLSFVQTAEGRAIPSAYSGGHASAYDYEYFYEDHQGNVRLTYGELKETISRRATMEMSLAGSESQVFKNITSTEPSDSHFLNTAYNYTKSSDQTLTPNRSFRTFNDYGSGNLKPIGPAISLELGTGDKVKAEVFATYTMYPTGTDPITAANLVTALAGNTFSYLTGEVRYLALQSGAPIIPGKAAGTLTVPSAYMAFLFFDINYQFISSSSEAIPVTSSAYNAFQKLSKNFIAPQPGYLYVYVANESNSNINVYWDEMSVVHQKNNSALQVTQASDYYPFGLTFNTYQQERINENYEAVQKNYYGFQGQEKQIDLDLGWSQFKWRMHDPALGRFGAVDPLSEKYLYNSTYAFSENRLLDGIELEGLEYLNLQPKFQYDNTNWDYLRGVGNGAVNIVNLFPMTYNSGVDNFMSLKNGTWTNDVSGAFKADWSSLKSFAAREYNYTSNTPFLTQLKQTGQFMVSPQGVEMATTMIAGSKIPVGKQSAFEAAAPIKNLNFPKGNVYSVAYEMNLKPTSYPGVGKYRHFQEANISLDAAMSSNPYLVKLGISVPRSSKGTILGSSPANWAWHHDITTGVMQLVPKTQHPSLPGGIFWETMHPGGRGGMSIWGGGY